MGIGAALTSLTVGKDLSGTVTEPDLATPARSYNCVTGTPGVEWLSLEGAARGRGHSTSLSVGQDLSGTVTTFSDGGAIAVTGNLSGTLTIGGSATSLTVGGNVSGPVSITHSTGSGQAGNLGTLSIAGNFTTGDTITVGGAVTGAASVTGTLAGTFTVGQSLFSLSVGQDLSGPRSPPPLPGQIGPASPFRAISPEP